MFEMTTRQKLWLFKKQFLMTKEDVLESFAAFMKANEAGENNDWYSSNKSNALKKLLVEFHTELQKTEIPSLDDWWFYQCEIVNERIELFLCYCDEIEFNDEGIMSSMSSTVEHALVSVQCEYLSVEEYAKLYDVTTTTVRQWIRRGKLRSAKKIGGEWTIPALTDKPGRGFESVTYSWEDNLSGLISQFPFLADTKQIYIKQDKNDKSLYLYETDVSEGALTTETREKLELSLLSSPDVKVEESFSDMIIISDRKYGEDDLANYDEVRFESIIASVSHQADYLFDIENYPGESFDCHDSYLVPVSISYRGVPTDLSEQEMSNIYEGQHDKCPTIGSLDAWLILSKQIMDEHESPYIICDDESGDLEYIMSALMEEDGPLNKEHGNPYQNILYIHELLIEHEYRRQGLGTRILSELPYVIANHFFNKPEIIAYFVAPISRDWKDETELRRESAVRYLAQDRVARHIESMIGENEGEKQDINFSSHYQFSDDDLNIALGRRHQGSSYPEELKNPVLKQFYEFNGFIEAGNSRVYYVSVNEDENDEE